MAARPKTTAKATKDVKKRPVARRPMDAMKAKGAAQTAQKRKTSKYAKGALYMVNVYKGKKEMTGGRLKASDITVNKYGKYVSKRRSARGVLNPWAKATAIARKALGITGFMAINSGPQGKALYAKIKTLLRK
mmetsp:Transcript_7301/g.7955  ORF Transcript_7301/g.7955 Transcript_7301/m.7955 type:complete len:133 (-) Transcript_7301:167-565(-)